MFKYILMWEAGREEAGAGLLSVVATARARRQEAQTETQEISPKREEKKSTTFLL